MSKSHAVATASASTYLVEQPTQEQWADLHRQVGRGRITKSTMQFILRGGLAIKEMKREEWIAREMDVLAQLKELKLLAISIDSDRVAEAWHKGFGEHHRYVPAGLTMPRLINACEDAGVKICSKVIPSGGEELPTEEGVMELDFSTIMRPTDDQHRPFMLDHDGHMAWAKEEGGDGLTSVEETEYLTILRPKLELGLVPWMGGWIRCRNRCGSDQSLGVSWSAGDGLGVYSDVLADRRWSYGAVPRKFNGVGA